MRRQIREMVGEDYADAARMATVDFERASINAVAATFPEARIAGCYFHLGQSVYRRVQRLGLQGKYEANEDFRLGVKMLSAIAFPPQEDIARGFGDLSPQFQDDEIPLLQYFGRTYVGVRVGNERRNPLFARDIWAVSGGEDVGITRTNNAVEAFRHTFSAGLAGADRLGAWRFVETLQSQQNHTDKDVADFDQGVDKVPKRRQVERGQHITAPTSRYGRGGDSMGIVRGIAYNYM